MSNYSLTLNTRTARRRTSRSSSQVRPSSPAAPVTSGGFIVAYTGTINLTFATGLPAGNYTFTVHTAGGHIPGLVDAAGNPIPQDFTSTFTLQSQPVFVTNLQMQNQQRSRRSAARGLITSSAQPFRPPRLAQLAPPPADLVGDRPLQPDPLRQCRLLQQHGAVDRLGRHLRRHRRRQLRRPGRRRAGQHRAARVSTSCPARPSRSSIRIPAADWVTADAAHPGTRLLMSLTPGTTLPADYYRLYLPNQLEPGNIDTRIFDIYGNQLDGEFLGNPTANGSYQDLLNTGVIRNGMSGDGVAGGAFMTGFVVVPAGNIIYARPDYVEDPLLPSTAPDGSLAKPYSTLAPEGDPEHRAGQPDPRPQRRPEQQPVLPLGLQPAVRPQRQRRVRPLGALRRLATGLQRPGRGRRLAGHAPARSDHRRRLAADLRAPGPLRHQPGHQQRQRLGPVRHHPGLHGRLDAQGPERVALRPEPGQRDPGPGRPGQQRGQLHVLRQRRRRRRHQSRRVEHDPGRGDWGGIVLRNFDQAVHPSQTFPVDGTLQGIGGPAISGADDAMSIFNFANISYAGGAVPQTQGTRYDAIDLFNSRPAITNDMISFTGGKTGTISTQAGDRRRPRLVPRG